MATFSENIEPVDVMYASSFRVCCCWCVHAMACWFGWQVLIWQTFLSQRRQCFSTQGYCDPLPQLGPWVTGADTGGRKGSEGQSRPSWAAGFKAVRDYHVRHGLQVLRQRGTITSVMGGRKGSAGLSRPLLVPLHPTWFILHGASLVHPAWCKPGSSCMVQAWFILHDASPVHPAWCKPGSSCMMQALFILHGASLVHPAWCKPCSSCMMQAWFILYDASLVHPAWCKPCPSCMMQAWFILYDASLVHPAWCKPGWNDSTAVFVFFLTVAISQVMTWT